MFLSWARRATLTRVDYSWVNALALSRMDGGRLMYTEKQILNGGDNSERPDAFPPYRYRPLWTIMVFLIDLFEQRQDTAVLGPELADKG
jgi:hypothetical protein